MSRMQNRFYSNYILGVFLFVSVLSLFIVGRQTVVAQVAEPEKPASPPDGEDTLINGRFIETDHPLQFEKLQAPISTQEKAQVQSEDNVLGLPLDTNRSIRLENLLNLAHVQGTVRIIVGLNVDFIPEGELRSPLAVDRQQQQIALAQEAVLKSLPGDITVNAKFEIIPYMALTVDEEALQALLQSSEINYIQEDRLSAPTLASTIPLIGADDVHAGGGTGTGWTVAVLDSGVQWDHEFLGGAANSRVVDEACFSTTDAGNGSTSICAPAPHEADSDTALCLAGSTNICAHGTHVAGIAAGSQANASVSYDGVAPEANVIAVQVFSRFPQFVCAPYGYTTDCVLSYESDQISGLQYVYSLRDTYNIAAVNMSLGGGRYYTEAACDADEAPTKAVIDSLRSVGIATVISSGNSSYKDSIGAPGCISTAVAVGATNDSDVVASFSNSSNLVELLAPGVFVDSSVPLDNGVIYDTYSGTSMAAPHVTGAWALIKQSNPTASVSEVLNILQNTGVVVTDVNGIGIPRIQIDAALSTGEISGSVTDTSNGNPIQGAVISAVSGGQFNTTTDENGQYSLWVPAGNYDVTASALGYQFVTQSNVAVQTGATSTADFALTAVPSYLVSGVVTDATTGWPLYASIDISSYPDSPVWTNPVTGEYSVTLPVGVTYEFTVSAWVDGYLDATQTVGPLSGDTTQNLALNADLTACEAPGYGSATYLTESFDAISAFPESGWDQVDTSGTGGNWATSATTVHPAGQPPHSGTRLAYFNSWTANNGNSTRLFRSVDLDLSSATAPEISFWMYHDTGFSSRNDRIRVQVSTNAGVTWTNVGAAVSRYNGSTGWQQHTISLNAYAGVSTVRIGFNAISAYGNDIHIDDVRVAEPGCASPVGGLVVGNVHDGNTSAGINGAAVSNEDGYNTTSAATPDDPNVADGFYTLFSPAGDKQFIASFTNYVDDVDTVPVVANDTVRHDFYLGSGLLSYAPDALDVVLPAGSSMTRPFTLTNNGSVEASFELFEISGNVTDVVQDGGFEGGTPNADWVEASTNFGTPLCDVATCGTGGGTGPRTGTYWTWFGGTTSTEVGSVEQTLTIPAGYATLRFWLEIPASSGLGFLNVSVDGDVLFSVTDADSSSYATYTEVVVDASAYADGNSHTLRFDSTTSGGTTNFFVDDVALFIDNGFTWLSETPASGTIAAITDQSIDVTFDASSLTPGQYTGQLAVSHDTPSILQNVPVTLTVVTGYLWNGSANSHWNDPLNWTPNGVPDGYASVVIDPANLTGAAAWPVLNVNPTLVDLTLAAGAELTIPHGRSLTVNHTLTNNGLLRQTIDISSAALTRFLHITGSRGPAYFGVDITPADAMGLTTVEIRGHQTAGCNQGGQLAQRCFDISPTTPQEATVRFWYLGAEGNGEDVPTMKAYHWNGGSWDQLDVDGELRGTEGPYEWVEVDNVDSYSPFGLADGSPNNPTAVSLQTLYASTPTNYALAITVLLFLILLTFLGLRLLRR